MELKYKLHNENKYFPTKFNAFSAGIDLYSPIDFVIKSHEKLLINLEISFSFPPGYYGLLKDKSFIAYKYGLTIMAGVIDNDYTGAVKVLFYNTSLTDVVIIKGTPICQMIISTYLNVNLCETVIIENTERGDKGFGSTFKVCIFAYKYITILVFLNIYNYFYFR